MRPAKKRPAKPIATSAMLALVLTVPAHAAEPGLVGAQSKPFWVAAKSIKQRDADRALRETLHRAADSAILKLGRSGAFSRVPAHHIALPSDLQSVRGDWNAVGRSGSLDSLDGAMNGAAELAAPMVRDELRRQIEDVDFSDAVAIVRSGDEAATQLFAARTRADLSVRIRPIIEAALTQSGAFDALGAAAAAAKSPGRAEVYRPQVIDATVNGELNAIFAEMRAEERAIRANPAGRGSPLLEDVFSAFNGAATKSGG